jgi:hypothetical protein
MTTALELTASDGRRFRIDLPEAMPALKPMAAVFYGPNGKSHYPLIGTVSHRFVARDYLNKELGVFTTANDAVCAVLRTAPWGDPW